MADHRELATLRIQGNSEVRAKDVAQFLQALDACYVRLSSFVFVLGWLQGYGLRQEDRSELREHLIRKFAMAAKVRTSHHDNRDALLLGSVRLESPGFWDFLGKLNIFEVIRLALIDRHEREKDRRYRSKAEERRLYLENLKLETEFIKGRLDVLREAGLDGPVIDKLVHEFVFRPLKRLRRSVDKNVVSSASVIPPAKPDAESETPTVYHFQTEEIEKKRLT